MAWQDDLLPASFRGVPFSVVRHSTGAGRRTQKHEYPKRDRPKIEDLGRRGEEVRIDAYVLGDDYFLQRDALRGVLGKGTVGELVHPYLGAMRVKVDGFDFREDVEEGRMARFSILFLEDGIDDAPDAVDDPDAAAGSAADALSDAAGEVTEAAMTVEGVPEYARTAAESEVETIGGAILALDIFSGASQELARLRDKATQLIATAAALARSPADLVVEVRSTLEAIADASGSALDSMYAYEALFGLEPAVRDRPAGTPISSMQSVADANAAAVMDLARSVAAAEAVRAAAAVDWETYEDAVGAQERLRDQIDAEADHAEDSAYQALMALLEALVSAVPGEDKDLPRLETITLRASQPSLVLAYDLYDDIGRADEIVERNSIAHPGFLPAGEPLQVLTDD